MSRRIYLDLDGVMADFDGTFPAVFGLDHRDMADDDMWLKINGHPSFFRDLPPMNGAVEFFRTIEHLDPIILTACPKSNYAHVATQKVEWVRAHLSAHVTVLPVLGGSSKPLFMHAKGDILIDDYRRNTEAWANAGGHAILHRGFDGTAAALEEAIGSYAPKAAQHARAVAYLHDVVHNETGETDAALSFSALSFAPDENMGYQSVGHVPLYRGVQPVEAMGGIDVDALTAMAMREHERAQEHCHQYVSAESDKIARFAMKSVVEMVISEAAVAHPRPISPEIPDGSAVAHPRATGSAGSYTDDETFPADDRAMLLYLMRAFDSESWECPSCGHSEDTSTMDSANALRDYLQTHPRPTGAPSGLDRTRETPRRQQAVEKLLALGWTYHHENGWTAAVGDVPKYTHLPGDLWEAIAKNSVWIMRNAKDGHYTLDQAIEYQVGAIATGRDPATTGDGMVSVVAEDANNYCRILTALGMEEEGDPVAEVEQLIAAAYDQGTADAGVTATTTPTGDQADEDRFGGTPRPRIKVEHDGRKFEVFVISQQGHHFVKKVVQLVKARRGPHPVYRQVWPKAKVGERVNSLFETLGVESRGRITDYEQTRTAPGVEVRS